MAHKIHIIQKFSTLILFNLLNCDRYMVYIWYVILYNTGVPKHLLKILTIYAYGDLIDMLGIPIYKYLYIYIFDII